MYTPWKEHTYSVKKSTKALLCKDSSRLELTQIFLSYYSIQVDADASWYALDPILCVNESDISALAPTSVSLHTHPELKFWTNSSSPFKWTEIPSQSSLEDFRFEPGVWTSGGLLQPMQDLRYQRTDSSSLIYQCLYPCLCVGNRSVWGKYRRPLPPSPLDRRGEALHALPSPGRRLGVRFFFFPKDKFTQKNDWAGQEEEWQQIRVQWRTAGLFEAIRHCKQRIGAVWRLCITKNKGVINLREKKCDRSLYRGQMSHNYL